MQNGIKSPDKEQWEINSASISFITVKTGKPCSPHNTSLKCYDHVFLCCVALIVLFYLSAQYLVVTAAPTILFSLPYSPSSRTFILPLGIMRLHALCHSLASPSCKDRSTIRTVPSNSTDPSTITLLHHQLHENKLWRQRSVHTVLLLHRQFHCNTHAAG